MKPASHPHRLLSGVVPPIVTPFTDDYAVDHASLRALCQHLIDAGVDGLYLGGTTGEFVLLTERERREVAETVVDAAAGRVPVFVQVGAATTAETIALARHAAGCGADGIGVITPYFYAYGDEELRRHFLAVAEAVDPLPVYLYNLPSHARNAISPVLAGDLFERAPTIVGIKDSSGDLQQLRDLRALGSQSILSGTDGMNLAALRLGCDGMISGNANAVPEPFVTLVRRWRAGEGRAAEMAQARIDAVRSVLFGAAGIANFKAVLVRQGILRTAAVRPPLAPAEEGVHLLTRLREAGAL